MAHIYRANFREYGDMPDPRQETPVRLQRVPNRSRPSKRRSPPSACSVCHPALPCLGGEGVLSTPYLMIISEAVGSWLKSEWISVAALRKCRSRGPGVRGRLAVEQEEGEVLKARSAEERAPIYGCGPLPQTLDIYRAGAG